MLTAMHNTEYSCRPQRIPSRVSQPKNCVGAAVLARTPPGAVMKSEMADAMLCRPKTRPGLDLISGPPGSQGRVV